MTKHTHEPLSRQYVKRVWYAISAVAVAVALWYVASRLTDLMVTVAICFFLALAIEPIVNRLANRGWSRSWATLLIFAVGLALTLGFLVIFGRLLIDQAGELIDSAPTHYDQLRTWLDSTFNVTIPNTDELTDQYLDEATSFVQGNTLAIASQLVLFLFAGLTVLLVTYYLIVDGPRFRRAVCSAFPRDTQEGILQVWELAIDKTSGYLVSRTILAAICTVFTSVFLLIAQVPYALALGVFTGVVSQFVPAIGTYIAGTLPVLVALSSSLTQGVATLVFIVVYQQVENLTLEPRISARTMEMNVAIAFLSVLAGAAILGPIGAVLALPVAATIQGFVGAYIQRNEVIESELTQVDDEAESQEL